MKKISLCLMMAGMTALNVQAYPFPPTIIDILCSIYKSYKPKDSKTDFEKFAKRYAPPQDVYEILEKNRDLILAFIKNSYGVLTIEENNRKLFLKTGCDDVFPDSDATKYTDTPDGMILTIHDLALHRVVNAARMRNYLEQTDCKSVIVPKKYFWELNDIGISIAEGIELSEAQPFNVREVQAFIKITEDTGFSDWHINNVIRTACKRIAIIDTEDQSFLWCNKSTKNAAAYLLFYNLKYPLFFPLEEDALILLNKLCKTSLIYNIMSNTLRDKPLPSSSRFDDSDIDFEAVKQEYLKMRDDKRASQKQQKRTAWNPDSFGASSRVQEA